MPIPVHQHRKVTAHNKYEFCIKMSRNNSTLSHVLLGCALKLPQKFLKLMVRFIRSPVAITSGIESEWGRKSQNETKHIMNLYAELHQTFSLQWQSAVNITLHSHPTIKLTPTDRCCSRVDKQEWRWSRFFIPVLQKSSLSSPTISKPQIRAESNVTLGVYSLRSLALHLTLISWNVTMPPSAPSHPPLTILDKYILFSFERERIDLYFPSVWPTYPFSNVQRK